MAQVFNLKGTPVSNITEIRTNTIKDQTGTYDIMTFDPASNTVTLHNVEFIWSSNRAKITVDDILVNTP